MKKVIRLSEANLIKLIKKTIKENSIFGTPDIDDAKHTKKRGKGYSHVGKEGDNELKIIFNGQRFSQEDLEFADYNDLGELPRVENGKLIISNPDWSY